MGIFKNNKDVRDFLSAHESNLKSQLADLIEERNSILNEMLETGDYDDEAFESISRRSLK